MTGAMHVGRYAGPSETFPNGGHDRLRRRPRIRCPGPLSKPTTNGGNNMTHGNTKANLAYTWDRRNTEGFKGTLGHPGSTWASYNKRQGADSKARR